ncbi:MAG: ornithine carbamoyltransferase, partial [Gemmatimonadetes bacterium]|nr:ornithine carbamoyltransferase [Gemmatimonadota bacterium]
MDMDLLTLKTWSPDDILHAVEMGLVIKKNPERYESLLKGQTLAMLFQKTSTRTRVSFEVGMHQLG